jgi:hypothetical protein
MVVNYWGQEGGVDQMGASGLYTLSISQGMSFSLTKKSNIFSFD